MNYTQELYNHNNLNYMIAYGGYSDIHNKDKVKGFDDNELYEFKCNWSHKGQQSPADFEEDLKWLMSVTSKPIIFLNGAEVAIENPQEKLFLLLGFLSFFTKKGKKSCNEGSD